MIIKALPISILIICVDLYYELSGSKTFRALFDLKSVVIRENAIELIFYSSSK